MSAHEVLTQCQVRGIHLTAVNGSLTYDAPKGALSPDLLALLKAHKLELLAALSGKINRWRVTHADGQVTEHSSRGLTEAEALALSRPWGEPVRAEPIAKPPPSHPEDLGALLTEACRGVPGIDAAAFRSLLSPEDVQDIAGGHIPAVPTLRAYAQSFAEGIRDGRIEILAKWVRA